MPPTTGENEKYHSGVSILFSSPLPGNRVMGAGDGSGPERRQAGFAEQERRQFELRHEHAADEQRIRHRDVARRRVVRRDDRHEGGPRAALFHAPSSAMVSATYSATATSSARRCRSKSPFQPCSASQRPRVCRSSLRRCEKATATSSPSRAGSTGATAGSGCIRTTAEWTAGGGSNASGGT